MKNIKAILITVLVLIIIIPLIIRGVNNFKDKKEQNKYEPRKETRGKSYSESSSKALRISGDGKWKVVSPPERIRYTGEYGEVYKGVLPGSFISIEDLTEPTCLITKRGKEYCSNGTENFGKNIIPNSRDNGELRFKSQNGETGYLNIYFWIPN